MPAKLEREAFLAVVRDTPLVSIDLIVEDEDTRILLGLRRNAPARGFWFVPGGRVLKNETLDTAFARLCVEELGLPGCSRSSASFLGAYQHFYDDNALGEPDFGTHYVVLAYRLSVSSAQLNFPVEQHEAFRWVLPKTIGQDSGVHPYSKAYFPQD